MSADAPDFVARSTMIQSGRDSGISGQRESSEKANPAFIAAPLTRPANSKSPEKYQIPRDGDSDAILINDRPKEQKHQNRIVASVGIASKQETGHSEVIF